MFTTKIDALFSELGESRIMCLATSADDRVTARSMSVIILAQRFYFQTDRSFLKYAQISRNPHAALCVNNIQVEGVCKELGHPLSPENEAIMNRYKELYAGSFDAYSHLASETLFEVTPTRIAVWRYDKGKPYQEFFDLDARTYTLQAVL